MKIQQSSEDYLETMYVLQEKYGYIRSIDIAKYLGVTKPSVSYAVKKLRESGYISMEANGPIKLTPPGLKIARRTYDRHVALYTFLTLLGVEEELAEEDACRIEHVISNDTYLAILKYIEEYHENHDDHSDTDTHSDSQFPDQSTSGSCCGDSDEIR